MLLHHGGALRRGDPGVEDAVETLNELEWQKMERAEAVARSEQNGGAGW